MAKILFIDLNQDGLEFDKNETPQQAAARWIQHLIVLHQRERTGGKGCSKEVLLQINSIDEKLDKAAENNFNRVDLEENEYRLVKSAIEDALVDAQFARIYSRIIDLLERSKDWNSKNTVSEKTDG